MLDRVTIVDDTLRRNVAIRITDHMRTEAIKAGLPIPFGQLFYIARDRGKTMQETVRSRKTFEGLHLRIAVRRARRYMRSGRPIDKAPRHITHALAAFLTADRKGFEDAARVA